MDSLEIKQIWEEFLAFELGHLQVAADLFREYEDRDPEEVIGNKIVLPCHFEEQKEYVTNILENEIDKRHDGEGGFTTIDDLPEYWPSYRIQEIVNGEGAPSEQTIQLIKTSINMDIVTADPKLRKKEPDLLERGLEPEMQAPNTVTVEEYEEMVEVPPMEF